MYSQQLTAAVTEVALVKLMGSEKKTTTEQHRASEDREGEQRDMASGKLRQITTVVALGGLGYVAGQAVYRVPEGA